MVGGNDLGKYNEKYMDSHKLYLRFIKYVTLLLSVKSIITDLTKHRDTTCKTQCLKLVSQEK